MIKVYSIELLMHIPFLRKYAWHMYSKVLANAFADSVNRAEEIRNSELPEGAFYDFFPEIKAINYTMAMLPAALIAYHIGELINEPDWLVKHLKG